MVGLPARAIAAPRYYCTPNMLTDLQDYAAYCAIVSPTIHEICDVIQGLLIHPLAASLYNEKLSAQRMADLSLRSARLMLKRLLEINNHPLVKPRDPCDRLVGNCRHYAVLACALLRHHGVAARVRCGFASYFDFGDHWICECWDTERQCWIPFDAQLDSTQCQAYDITFDPYDLPQGQFLSAGAVWQQCRAGQADPRRFGYMRWRGLHFIAGSIVRDLAALNKIELLADDLATTSQEVTLSSEKELARLDHLAAVALQETDEASIIQAAYAQDTRARSAVEACLDERRKRMSQEVPETTPTISQEHPSLKILQGLTPFADVRARPRASRRQQGQQQPEHVAQDAIVIRGAAHHNLKGIDVTIPRSKFVVLTGVSGSGKSSLAFDTIYAEGQRRYVESLSPFVRHHLEQVEKPRVDGIWGLSPTVAIEQKTVSKNPRSTVGTITEVMHYVRLLFSRIGTAHCITCGHEIRPLGPSEIAYRVAKLPAGTTFHLLASPIHQQKGSHVQTLAELQRRGYIQARVDGRPDVALADLQLSPQKTHSIEISIAAFQVPVHAQKDHDWFEQLVQTVRTAFRLGNGTLVIVLSDGNEITLSEQKICARCGARFPDLTSQHFSPNTPFGMCQTCGGLGTRLEVDPQLIVEHPTRSILDGAVRWFGDLRKEKGGTWPVKDLPALARYYEADLERPWQELPPAFRNALLFGEDQTPVMESEAAKPERGTQTEAFQGLVYHIFRIFRQSSSEGVRSKCESYMRHHTCPTCTGSRLSTAVRAVTLGGKTIQEVGELPINRVLSWVESLADELDDDAFEIACESLKEVTLRLQFMLNVGLHYLALNRPAPSLSGGEGQRLRLASQLSCGLVSVLYVLDEPSIGLHARDQRTLLQTLLNLRDMGNSVLVVEHDAETMRNADWILDMGPGAGMLGGQVVVAGTPEEIMASPTSLTGGYLSGRLNVCTPHGTRRRTPGQQWLSIVGASLHNLKQVHARLPLGVFLCVTGVSGSGKSSLINGTLYPALLNLLHRGAETPGPYERIEGVEHLDKVITITQDAIGRTPRSNPATYIGIFDDIRALFAATEQARKKGYRSEHFSFNVQGGRCESCKGHGQRLVEMHFLPDVWVTCKECQGTRFNSETLGMRYKGKNIAEVLDMDIRQALELFSDVPRIARHLRVLHAVGLDYIKLGQSAMTFSGGEAQRIKLGKELSRVASGRTLYILDEPTTGLHFADIQRLVDVLHQLVDTGNTVLVIEHNIDVIKTADWLLDMGPEGGDAGGYIVAEGTPETVAATQDGFTSYFLREELARFH